MTALGMFTAGLSVFLLAASIVGRLLARGNSTGARAASTENLNQRIQSWWLMAFVLLGSLWAGKSATLLLFAALSIWSLDEFFAVTRVNSARRGAPGLAIYWIVPTQYLAIAMGWSGFFTVLVPLSAFLLLPAISAIKGDTSSFLERNMGTQCGLLWTVYCISHVPALHLLHGADGRERTTLLILYFLVVVQMSDVLQYIFGKVWGMRPIAPSVSPSKTIEGLVGGGLSATVLGSFLSWMTPFTMAMSTALSALIVICGFLGGLTLSAVKRSFGAKDWGSRIGGHGGILDRLDSVCFSAPVFFHVVRILYDTTAVG